MPDPQLVKQAFARIAPRYDLLNTLLSLGLHKAWRRRAVALCGRGDWALDVCAGTGDLSRRLAKRFRRVVGVDFSRPMLEVAQRRGPSGHPSGGAQGRLKGGGLDLIEGDALALPFADDVFDCAITGFSLRNVADLERLFAEMARVVRPGGRVVSLELTRPPGRALRRVHGLYLRWVVPGAGSVVDGAAYRHLAETVQGFREPEAIAAIMASAGMRAVRIDRLSHGIASVHLAVVG